MVKNVFLEKCFEGPTFFELGWILADVCLSTRYGLLLKAHSGTSLHCNLYCSWKRHFRTKLYQIFLWKSTSMLFQNSVKDTANIQCLNFIIILRFFFMKKISNSRDSLFRGYLVIPLRGLIDFLVFNFADRKLKLPSLLVIK